MSETITVVIPAFNAGAYLRQSVTSASSQEGVNVEVIVVDDGSTDDTAEVARSFGAGVRLHQQANSGTPAAARNAGLRLCKAGYVLFLDADDVLRAGAIASMLAVIRSRLPKAIVYGDWETLDVGGNSLGVTAVRDVGPDAFHGLLAGNVAPPLCFLMPTAVFEQVSAFDESPQMRGHEDWDLWLRVAAAGFAFICVRRTIGAYRITPGSVSKNIPGMVRSGFQTLRKHRHEHVRCEKCAKARHDATAFLRQVFVRQFLKPSLKSWTGNLRSAIDIAARTARYTMTDLRFPAAQTFALMKKLTRFGYSTSASPEEPRT